MEKLVLHTLGFLISETLAPIFKVEANRRTQKRCREKACRRKQQHGHIQPSTLNIGERVLLDWVCLAA
jgi:hypothetical protein